MAGPSIARTSVAIRTTTGLQDITVSGFGTPKAAIIIISTALSAGTIQAGAILGVGWTDGTNSVCSGMASEDGTLSSNCGRAHTSTKIITLPNYTGSALIVEANFDSWVTDGVRINVTTSDGSAYLMNVILIGGAGTISAAAGQVSLGTGTSAINTTVGFTPSLVLFHGTGTANSTITTAGKFCFGASVPGASQAAVAFAEADATADGTSAALVSSSYGYAEVDTTPAMTYGVSIGTYANGFSATPSASASSDVMGYLALEFPAGNGVSVTTETLPTSTGSYSKTGLSFTPGFLLTAAAGVSTAVGTVDDADAESFSLTTVTRTGTTTSLCSTSYGVDDGAATMDTSADHNTTYEVEYSGTANGTRRAYSSFTSFNSDGWTKNLTATDAVAYKSLSLAIQANSSVAAFMFHRRMQGMS